MIGQQQGVLRLLLQRYLFMVAIMRTNGLAVVKSFVQHYVEQLKSYLQMVHTQSAVGPRQATLRTRAVAAFGVV